MVGSLYIDGTDVYLSYGVFVTQGGYNGLVNYPALKAVLYNDWPEEDGIEADLSNPVLNTKDFTVSFACNKKGQLTYFFGLLSDMSYHKFEFRDIGKTFILRLVAQPDYFWHKSGDVFTLTFADDFPLRDYTYVEPVRTVPVTGYVLDDRDFADYGVTIREDTLSEVLKLPAVKPKLYYNYATFPGAYYDDAPVNYQSKDVNVYCTLRADTFAEFWRNYDALLYDLTRPNERTLYVSSVNTRNKCFYRSSAISGFTYVNDKIWADFTLVLTFTSFRLFDTTVGLRLIDTGGFRFLSNNGLRKI